MKKFAGTFVISSIIIYVILFFGGALIVENILALIILLALIVSVLYTIFTHQELRIEELEIRIKTIESQVAPNKEPINGDGYCDTK